MSWTTPTTRATGDLITAAIWNTDVVNNLKEIGGERYGVAGTYDLNNTVTESSLIAGAAASGTTGWQIAAGALGTSGHIEGFLILDWMNNDSTQRSVILKLKLGGATLDTTGAITDATTSSSSRKTLRYDFKVANVGAANSQAASVGYQLVGASPGVDPASQTLASVDTTAAQYLDITATLSGANAAFSVRRHYGYAWIAT